MLPRESAQPPGETFRGYHNVIIVALDGCRTTDLGAFSAIQRAH